MEKPQKSHPSCSSTIETEDFERRMTLEKFQVNFPQVKNFSQHSLTYTFFLQYTKWERVVKVQVRSSPLFVLLSTVFPAVYFIWDFTSGYSIYKKESLSFFCKILKQRKISVLFETLFWCPVFIHSFLECIECTSLQLSRILLCQHMCFKKHLAFFHKKFEQQIELLLQTCSIIQHSVQNFFKKNHDETDYMQCLQK